MYPYFWYLNKSFPVNNSDVEVDMKLKFSAALKKLMSFIVHNGTENRDKTLIHFPLLIKECLVRFELYSFFIITMEWKLGHCILAF